MGFANLVTKTGPSDVPELNCVAGKGKCAALKSKKSIDFVNIKIPNIVIPKSPLSHRLNNYLVRV